MENLDIVSEEMRLAAISPIEVLIALEKRGEISTTFKNRYLEQSQIIREEVINRLVAYQGKLPLLVDQNFLREIYELDGVSIIAQKCDIFVLEVVFDNIENEQKNIKIGQETIQLLDNMRDAIFDEKEQGFIRLCERYLGNERSDKEVHTAALFDELQFTMENDTAFFCDDRMVTCYSHMGKAGIYNVTDFIEFVHEKGIITDEKYVNVVTRKENSSDALCEIGIGAYVKLATEDMPDYYAEKIRSHAKICPLLEQFENSFILLDRHHLIERSVFLNGWKLP